jgi:hypothetical protein
MLVYVLRKVKLILSAVNFDEDRLLPIATRTPPHREKFVTDVGRTDFIEPISDQVLGGAVAQNVLRDAAHEAELAEALVPNFVVHRATILAVN